MFLVCFLSLGFKTDVRARTPKPQLMFGQGLPEHQNSSKTTGDFIWRPTGLQAASALYNSCNLFLTPTVRAFI